MSPLPSTENMRPGDLERDAAGISAWMTSSTGRSMARHMLVVPAVLFSANLAVAHNSLVD